MIVWIDGTHGVGKTTVAKALIERLKNRRVGHIDSDGLDSSVYEAMMLHGGGCLPQNNFTFLCTLRNEIEKKISEGCDFLVVEMALTQKECIEYLLEPLRARHQIIHIILTASMETVKERIRNDPDRDQKFAQDYLGGNIAFLTQNYPEAIYIDTERKSIPAVCDAILAECITQEQLRLRTNLNPQGSRTIPLET